MTSDRSEQFFVPVSCKHLLYIILLPKCEPQCVNGAL
jgi:hypothetical protein